MYKGSHGVPVDRESRYNILIPIILGFTLTVSVMFARTYYLGYKNAFS